MNMFFKPNNNNTNKNPHNLSLPEAITSLQTQLSSAFKSFAANIIKTPPPFAQIAPSRASASMSVSAIEERMAGVPVYALTNAAEEFVLISAARTGKSMGLFCFNEKDAEALLDEMRNSDTRMRTGAKIVPVALNKIFQLKVNGVAFRLIPEMSQVKNAIRERQRVGISDDNFPGVPVFQSQSLVLKTEGKSYRPVFFRKEDLENSLTRASQQQNRLNPALKGDIRVAVLEEVIRGLKDGSKTWDDVVFIPPGFDISTSQSKQ